MHNGLSCSLSKCIVKFRAIVRGQVVAHERLAAIFVDSLEDLVRRSASGKGEIKPSHLIAYKRTL